MHAASKLPGKGPTDVIVNQKSNDDDDDDDDDDSLA